MKNLQLKDIDPEDIEDLLEKVEDSFDISFSEGEFLPHTTFGEFCDHIAGKIQGENTTDCSVQQAFYKLREGIAAISQCDKSIITPHQQFAVLFPEKNRRHKIKQLENHLGFEMHLLRPPHSVTMFFTIALLGSLVGLFFVLPLALLGLAFSLSGFWIIRSTANVLDIQTVGQVAEKITREHYKDVRRHPATVNKAEIEKILIDWFSVDLNLDKSELTRDAKFN